MSKDPFESKYQLLITGRKPVERRLLKEKVNSV